MKLSGIDLSKLIWDAAGYWYYYPDPGKGHSIHVTPDNILEHAEAIEEQLASVTAENERLREYIKAENELPMRYETKEAAMKSSDLWLTVKDIMEANDDAHA